MSHDAIAVIDFGGQYAHLIANKIRHLGVLAEIRQPEDPLELFLGYRGIIISGSPSLSSCGQDADYTKAIYDLKVPILGFCFGHQEIAKHYGGRVINGGQEWGATEITLTVSSLLFDGLEPKEIVWMSHFDSVIELGPGFRETAYSISGGEKHSFAAIENEELKRYGVQFHPEVDDTVHGERLIANFVLEICGCRPTWTMERFTEEALEKIRNQVGDNSVFLLVSGGVDSTVAAGLLAEAIGPQRLTLLHVDNGLMRKDESRNVVERMKQIGLGSSLHFVDASQVFLDALAGITDPEKKRKAIGDTFIAVFESEARRLGLENHLLGQGTIYPDTIETGGTRRSDTIKTHHNRVPLVQEMIEQGRVIEPLAELYKTEVREMGRRLGIDHDLLWRHPFPGPGLGIRLLCSDTVQDSSSLSELSAQAGELASEYGLRAIVLPIRSVGVKADLRSYEHPVMLSGPASWETLLEAAGAILRRVSGINRCVWNLLPGHPLRVSSRKAGVNRERLDLLREADHLVMTGLRRHQVYHDIWQCPTVFLPLALDDHGAEMTIIRPILSERAMTAAPARLPEALLEELRREIPSLPGISGLALDLTSKPPATIEWE